MARLCSCPVGAGSTSVNTRPPTSSGKSQTNAIISVVDHFAGGGKDWTIEELARWGGIGGLGPGFVGSPTTIADILQEWTEETDVDGYNLAYAVTHETFEDVVDYLVPELQKRGAYPTAYREGTLREKLFGGGAYLPESHPAHRYRDIEAVKREEALASARGRTADRGRGEDAMGEPILRLSDISLSFKGIKALSNLSFDVRAARSAR